MKASGAKGRKGLGGAFSRRTVTRTYKTPMLILCTGKHCSPYVPSIPSDGSVPMIHSSKVTQGDGGRAWHGMARRGNPQPTNRNTKKPQPTNRQVHDWQALKGKNVAVVGAGASALDMAINTLRANEGQPASVQLHWLLRQPKHFGGFDYADLFLLTVFQLVFGMHANDFINLVMNLLIYTRFWSMGLSHWLPRTRLDLTKSQYIPGRAYLLRNHHRIDRRVGVEVRACLCDMCCRAFRAGHNVSNSNIPTLVSPHLSFPPPTRFGLVCGRSWR